MGILSEGGIFVLDIPADFAFFIPILSYFFMDVRQRQLSVLKIAEVRRCQWVFPQENRWKNAKTGEEGRHHVHESIVQKAVTSGVRKAGLAKRATCHTFQHPFATHSLESGYDIRTVQELLGPSDVKTTMIYTHVLNKGPAGVRSPVDGFRNHDGG